MKAVQHEYYKMSSFVIHGERKKIAYWLGTTLRAIIHNDRIYSFK